MNTSQPVRSLVEELRQEYPQLSGQVVAATVDRAYELETRVAGGSGPAPDRVARTARDRLDALRGRGETLRLTSGRTRARSALRLALAPEYVLGVGVPE